MHFLPTEESPRVAVVGFGYVGSCIAATLADRGHDVVGIDADAALVGELTSGYCRFQEHGLAAMIERTLAAGTLRLTTEISAAGAADIVLVCVGTPVRSDGSCADEALRGACRALAQHLRRGQLVLVKSTVPPGTTREVVLPLLEESGLVGEVDFGLGFTPERLAEGTALKELVTFPIVVGGLGARSTAAASEFWHTALGVPVMPRTSLEAAEITKLASNWWIDLNIAMANELAKFCGVYGVDVLEVIDAANTIRKGSGNINILLPGVGVGGSCLTKDPWMVWNSAAARGVDIRTAPVGREVNDGMPEYTAKIAIDQVVGRGLDPSSCSVAVLGLAFKNDTGDLRATPTVDAVAALVKAGFEVRLHDPLVDPDEAEELFGIRPTADLMAAVTGVDAVAVFAMHRSFRQVDLTSLPVNAGCLLLDGRAYWPADTIRELRAAGFTVRGVGRGTEHGTEHGTGTGPGVAA